ncbi:RNA polymerase sigma factor [Parasediminibacterium sp. JCM 36343]|uniref:RNA polymerase sigma factor n=1 Tax=Parasediminibacterium sp. JCM 36343 TaxID=3374279 RepID=UPI003979170B
MPLNSTGSDNPLPFPDREERLLLQQVSQGSREAYTTLYSHYLPILYKYIYRFTRQSHETTEEILQEVFLIIWEKKETLVAVNSFEKYVYKIAKNKLLNLIKHQDFKKRLHQNFGHTQDSAHTNTEKHLQYAEYHATALKAINNLPEKRREVFLLSTQGGLSLDEIAGQLAISKSRVKQQLYTAKEYIKQYLHDNAEWLIVALFYAKWKL